MSESTDVSYYETQLIRTMCEQGQRKGYLIKVKDEWLLLDAPQFEKLQGTLNNQAGCNRKIFSPYLDYHTIYPEDYRRDILIGRRQTGEEKEFLADMKKLAQAIRDQKDEEVRSFIVTYYV